jgi:hypothetical protein
MVSNRRCLAVDKMLRSNGLQRRAAGNKVIVKGTVTGSVQLRIYRRGHGTIGGSVAVGSLLKGYK